MYTYTCPPYSEDCVDGIATDYVGWLVFALMMIGNVGSDFISGIKLLILTGSRTKIVSLTKRTRLFIGGSCLCFVSCLTVLTSLVYNVAIAKTNPDIVGLTCLILFTTIYVLTYLHLHLHRQIINSIIILFINEIDEKIYDIIVILAPDWVEQVQNPKKIKAAKKKFQETEKKDDYELELKVENLEIELKELRELVGKLSRGRPESVTRKQKSRHLSVENGDHSSLFLSESIAKDKRQNGLYPSIAPQDNGYDSFLTFIDSLKGNADAGAYAGDDCTLSKKKLGFLPAALD